MIDFKEELEKFKPSTELDDAQDAIYQRDLSDVMDIIQTMINESSAPRGRRK